MSTGCRDCQVGLDHCHGTLIRHVLRRSECTEDGCAGREWVPHTFAIDCATIGCTCDEPTALAV